MQLGYIHKFKLVSIGTLLLLFLIHGQSISQDLMSGCESVAFDSVHNRYLVSSLINQQIVSIDMQGNQSVFKAGIPSFGNCITDSVLYVAGGTRVKGVDLETAEVVMDVNFPGSIQLDGVTVDRQGYLYVVATRSDKIFKLNLTDGTLEVLVYGGLSAVPQDIIFDDTRNRLLVCHWTSNAPVIEIDPDTGSMDTVAILGPGYSDGITVDASGNVYVGSYDDGGKIYMYDGDFINPPALIAVNMGEPAGIDVNRINNVLAVPDFSGDTVRFIQLPAIYLNADFSADTKTGHAPFTIQFNEVSSANPQINSWSWDLDNDGLIDSEEQNPVWTYDTPGSYTVKLTLTSDSLSEEIFYENYISVFNGQSAIEFPSAGSYVQVEPSEAITLDTSWTIEGWLMPANMSGKYILDNGAINLFTSRSSNALTRRNSLGIKFIREDGTLIKFSTSESSLTLDTWNHFALSYNFNASILKVYINGDEELLTIADSVIFEKPLKVNNEMPLILGNSSGYNRGLFGSIDEIRIWNEAKTGEEIRQNMEEYISGNENGLAAHWQMNEGNGTIINDITGNNNHGLQSGCNYSDGIDFSVFTSVEEGTVELSSIPGDYRIMQNYPNPFNPETTIEFMLPVRSHVQITVYNISGELVTFLANGEFGAGTNRVGWDGRNNLGSDVSSGIYFYRILTPKFSEIRKMILLR